MAASAVASQRDRVPVVARTDAAELALEIERMRSELHGGLITRAGAMWELRGPASAAADELPELA